PEAFVRAAVRNAKTDWIRRGEYRDDVPMDAAPEAAVASWTTPESVFASKEIVEAALKTLSARNRRLIELRYTAGASYEEMATALGTTVGAIASALYRAVKALKDALG